MCIALFSFSASQIHNSGKIIIHGNATLTPHSIYQQVTQEGGSTSLHVNSTAKFTSITLQ